MVPSVASLWGLCVLSNIMSVGAKRFYFPDNSVCCGDNVHDRFAGGKEYACCDNTIISLDSNVCCNNVKWPRLPGDEMACCGKELINQTTTICCINDNNPSLVGKHVRRENIACCGHLPIDLSMSNCFWNDKSQPVLASRNQDFCEGRLISKRIYTCCQGKVYDKPYLNPQNIHELNPRSGCCGTTGYDPTSHKCCPSIGTDALVIPDEEDLQCCRGSPNGYVNSTYQLCCDGVVKTPRTKYDKCCGKHLYDTRGQGCCHETPYDKGTHQCCRGLPSGIVEQGKKCCGGKELHKDNLCCDALTQVTRQNPDDDACCQDFDTGDYATYNSTTYDCNEGAVVSRMNQFDSNCGGQRYLSNKAVCCDYSVHPYPPGETLGCCRRWDLMETVYSQNTQMCCDGYVFNTTSDEKDCCNGKAYPKRDPNNPCIKPCGDNFYTPDKSLCCGRQVLVRADHGDACCGNMPYFSTSQTCCGGQLYNSTGECCGQDIYNPDKQKCCGDYHVIAKNSKERCCHDFMVYKKKHGVCKANGLVARKKNIKQIVNMCKKHTWSDYSGLEVEVCARSIAIQCNIRRKKYDRKNNEYKIVFTKCENLPRNYREYNHRDFGVANNQYELEVKLPSSKMRCKLGKERVIMFLDKKSKLLKKHRLYKLYVSQDDAFRVVKDTKFAREIIQHSSMESYCTRIADRMEEGEIEDYFKNTIPI